jgi:drug/metabolite transporter (DMT)-like permease
VIVTDGPIAIDETFTYARMAHSRFRGTSSERRSQPHAHRTRNRTARSAAAIGRRALSSNVREAAGATQEQRTLLTGLLLAGLGAVAFSGKAIIVKLSYRYGVDAVTVIMYRMVFALPLFAVLAWWAGRDAPPLTRRDWLAVFSLGFTGYYLASFLDFAGLQYIGASFERLILYLNPTIVLILNVVLFRHRVSRGQVAALVLSYAGVLVVYGHDMQSSGSNAALGAVLVFGSAVSYALYLVYSGAAVKRLGALRLSGLAASIACVLCIAQFFVLRPPSAIAVAPEVIWLAILNATLCTFVPILLVMLAIERIGASLAAQMGMIGPLSTILLSVWLLDEPFTIWVAMGTVLVISGVGWLARAPRER